MAAEIETNGSTMMGDADSTRCIYRVFSSEIVNWFSCLELLMLNREDREGSLNCIISWFANGGGTKRRLENDYIYGLVLATVWILFLLLNKHRLSFILHDGSWSIRKPRHFYALPFLFEILSVPFCPLCDISAKEKQTRKNPLHNLMKNFIL